MPPIIGITTGGRHEVQTVSLYYDSFYAVPTLYIDATRRAGGIPLLLPPGDGWQAALPRLDAVIVTGGNDVSPACYNGNVAHPNLTPVDDERDSSEIDLIRQLAAGGKPALCVCRGMQVMNVALGGTLHPHIPDIRAEDIHRNAGGGWRLHPVHVTPGSSLGRIMDADTVTTFSGHHQAVKDIAPGLQVAATAPDGIVEALSLPDHPWLLGVQWHPEKSAAEDPTQQRLFDALVAAAQSVTV